MTETETCQPKPIHQLEIKPLRLADAAILRRMGVFSGSKKAVVEAIRHLLTLNGSGCSLVTGFPGPAEELPATAPSATAPSKTAPSKTGVSESASSDAGPHAEPMTGFIALLPDAFYPEIGRLTVRVTDQAFLPAMLELACRTAFVEQPFLRIEALMPSFPEAALRCFKDIGFRTDAIVPGALTRSPDMADLHQLSLAKTLNRFPAVGLVPYKRGLLSVTGTAEAIDAVAFHESGEPVASPYLRDMFTIWGLVDEKVCLRPTEACLKLIRSDGLPAMVAKATAQLEEYIAGERREFDLELNLAQGSPFQRAVWTALQSIPYGMTETYLDVALKLAGGDLKKARAMSRAIGSACGANPVPVIVPCHRVIGRNGRLIGFSGGIANKEYLLEHELFRRR